jgi:hypothetical protein
MGLRPVELLEEGVDCCSATIKVEERVNQDERKSGEGSRFAVYRIGG